MPEQNNSLEILFGSITDVETTDKLALEVLNKIKKYADQQNAECQELIKQYHALRQLRRKLFNIQLEKESRLNMVYVN